MLQSIVTVAGSTMAVEDVEIPQGLFETLAMLHGTLLNFHFFICCLSLSVLLEILCATDHCLVIITVKLKIVAFIEN